MCVAVGSLPPFVAVAAVGSLPPFVAVAVAPVRRPVDIAAVPHATAAPSPALLLPQRWQGKLGSLLLQVFPSPPLAILG